ncbi:hypothetical protein NCC49_001563 [Naganishia albida]|nr:hypothetical protein NCC49_001563 [Naganishia albida]
MGGSSIAVPVTTSQSTVPPLFKTTPTSHQSPYRTKFTGIPASQPVQQADPFLATAGEGLSQEQKDSLARKKQQFLDLMQARSAETFRSTASTATTTSTQTSGLARSPAANAEKTAAVTAARERVEAAERDTTGSSGEPSARRVEVRQLSQRPSAGLLDECQLPGAPSPNATVGSGSLQKGMFLPKRQRNQSLENRAEVILVSGVSASRRLGGAASQPNAASGCKRSSSSLLSKRGKSLASQSPAALPHPTSSPGGLPKRKSAILEPARTGAVSPYGHRLADAPETSALLAELEYLTRGPDTPTVEAKPDVGSTSTGQAAGGGQYRMYGMPGAGPSHVFGIPSSSSANHEWQPMPSRPIGVRAPPLPAAQAISTAKGKAKAASPSTSKRSPAKPNIPEEKRPARKLNSRSLVPTGLPRLGTARDLCGGAGERF